MFSRRKMYNSVRSRRRNFVARNPSLALALVVLAASSQLTIPLVESFFIAPTKPSLVSRNELVGYPLQFRFVPAPPVQRRQTTILSSSPVQTDAFVKAEDLEGLQALFSKYCDKEGLMTKEVALQIPTISELLVRTYPSMLCLPCPLAVAHDDSICSRITPRL